MNRLDAARATQDSADAREVSTTEAVVVVPCWPTACVDHPGAPAGSAGRCSAGQVEPLARRLPQGVALSSLESVPHNARDYPRVDSESPESAHIQRDRLTATHNQADHWATSLQWETVVQVERVVLERPRSRVGWRWVPLPSTQPLPAQPFASRSMFDYRFRTPQILPRSENDPILSTPLPW